jgi:DNA repair protein RecO (recombination protein O)
MSVEWQAPAVVLDLRPHGEGGAVVTVLTEAHGRHAGLVKGGGSRAQAGLWLPGNLIEARWVARLSDQLGSLSGELVHPAAALAMDEPLALALLSSACAIAADALPEREAYPRAFAGLVSLIGHLAGGVEGVVADYVRFEALILAELGYGLDLATCAVTGVHEGLTHVSPRTGRAVSAGAAAPYLDKLLPLPAFMRDSESLGEAASWVAGLKLTGYFLERDAFGARHRPLPEARFRLAERIAALIAD